MSDSSDKRKREGLGLPPRPVWIALLVFVALIAGWTAIWYEGTRRAEAELSAWMVSQAAQGRRIDCAEQGIGGYPFRVVIECASPSAEFVENGRQVSLSAGHVQAVAMVWQPHHLIIGVEGPLRVESGAGEGAAAAGFDVEWSNLRSSLRAPGGRITRFDTVIQDFRFAPDPGLLAPGAPAEVTADRLDLHQRDEPDGLGTELAVNAAGLAVSHTDLPTAEAVDVALLARLDGLPSPMPRELPAFVAAWRDNSGAVEILDLRIAQGDSMLAADGRVAPDAHGRPEGRLTVSLAGPDVRTPGAAGAFAGVGPVLAAALRFGGRPAEIDGREAVSGDIEMRDGRARFGPVPIARLPALF